MDLAVLKAEVQGDPAGLGYAQHLPAAPGVVCDMLNAVTTTMVKSRMVNARTVLAECQPGAGALLDKLVAIGTQVPDVKWAVGFLQQSEGLDVGSPVTQGMLTQLAQIGTLTPAEASKLQALAIQPCSRAEQIGLGPVTEADLRAAGVV